MSKQFKLAVDVGGTFTDVVLFDDAENKMHLTKTPSSPGDPSEGVINGIKKIIMIAGILPEEIHYFVHGTTFATNAFLENKGSEVALLTTDGFKDVIEIGRQKRPKLYDLFLDKPSALVERRFRFGIKERMTAEGDVLETLDEKDVKKAVETAKENGITSIAVSYLHSYINPKHELMTAQIIKEVYPECQISLSHQISPEFREYERTITTVVNAYLKPQTRNYFINLEKKLKELNVKIPYIMKSNGGVMTMKEASENVIQTLLSGPAGGVVAAGFVAQQMGIKNIITFDMGGTSSDVALVEQQLPRITLESRLKGYPLKVPMIEMETVGAGGGSLGWVDNGGLLKVGPQSAGAIPGPACYGNGGEQPAITDANLLLGRIDPTYFLGGEMRLDTEAAKAAYEQLSVQTELKLEEVAAGMVKIANHHMAEAVRLVSVQKGYDPEEFTLFAFGGASPLHATAIARELGIPKVVIPKASSQLSAVGFLVADIRHDFTSTKIVPLELDSMDRISLEFEKLSKKGKDMLDKESVLPNHQLLTYKLDLRFKGQAFEISVDINKEEVEFRDIDCILSKFHAAYEREYGYCDPKEPVEVVNYRLSAIGLQPQIEIEKKERNREASSIAAKKGVREVYLFSSNCFENIDVYDLDVLIEGDQIEGPAVIDGVDTTIMIEINEKVEIDYLGNVIITLKGAASSDSKGY
ncbi:hydantoinase/oxoprolinase family protein [Halalkalibacter alkaliphilus]|uniref:Hydantoinase/oxoprolinase family protein n=1 Tax=Halalkalibacter alkaliphilus TaxID=2917993 RepID=A0A9X2CWL0_9BACI|nr:hydantoinase/oxoprolinase family protein [Halalkalibacter alkaliphilus]MCL7749608.1 hydantoinase/oxoprolinase family protein [Halalkalibacter alkaliphilus]